MGEEPAEELNSEDETRANGSGGWRCRWGSCPQVFKEQQGLIHHLHTGHIGAGKDNYACEWIDCGRKGSKQATRHSLITHCRAHTGERPYTCYQEGCRKTFTRSDAMNKHLRSLHGIVTEAPNKKKPTRSPGLALRVLPLKDWSTTTDVELMEDTDLMDVLPRIRTRQKFWTVTGDDLHRVERLRERHPRGGEEESDESFDEGMGMRYPMDPVVQGIGIDEGGEMNVGSRTRSQVRFIVAKAKLMLVDEENAMRRRELKELMDQERRQEMGEGGKVSAKE